MLRSRIHPNEPLPAAHLLLLSKFISTRDSDSLAKDKQWQAVLKETVPQAVSGFIAAMLIEPVSVQEKLDAKFGLANLKQMLKEKGLPVSGKKIDLIERLISADQTAMAMSVTDLQIFRCSEKGRKLVEDYLAGEKAKRVNTEISVQNAIREGNFRHAVLLRATFEAEQVIPVGLGIDWKHYDTKRDETILKMIFSRKPKVLSMLNKEQIEQVRLCAAMGHVMGYSYGKWPLPDDFKTDSPLENIDLVHVLMTNVHFHREMKEFRDIQKAGIQMSVEILTRNDEHVCAICKEASEYTYSLSEVPELPHEKCTNPHGCRCSVGASIA